TPEEYGCYARSVVDYETAGTVPNRKEIAFWGTRHRGDPATTLSAGMLVTPLAEGLPGGLGALRRPIHEDAGYARILRLGEDATRDALLGLLHAERPPALLFTASHGMTVRAGQPAQAATQGALLCQDWTGIGTIRPE